MTTHKMSPISELIMTRFRELGLRYVHRGAAQVEAEFAFEVTRHTTPAEGYADGGYADYVCQPLYWKQDKGKASEP